MDVHVALPNGHAGVTIDELLEITVAAEELGFDGVWPLDHVLAGPDLKERYPWVVEPMTLLGYLAARTTKIRLGTSIIVLGMRNPFVVAKQAATLDLLCSGRFTLGLGAGYSEPEFRNVGAADVWSTRGQRLDEAIQWAKGLRDAVLASPILEFSTSGFVGTSTRSIEIVIRLKTPQGVQDVPCFTIACSYSQDELTKLLADPMASIEALQQAHHQRWLAAYGVRPLELWTVPEARIWQGTEPATSAWLTRQVQGWAAHWYPGAKHQVMHRRRTALEIDRVEATGSPAPRP